MRIAIGTVVDGRIVVDGEQFVNGTKVAILAPENTESFELTAEQESEILESIVQADNGQLIDLHDLIDDLNAQS